MDFKSKDKYLNHLGEFSDPVLEREFSQEYMHNSMRFIKPIVLFLGILNTIFIIADYFVIQNKYIFWLIAISKILFFLLVLIFSTRIKYIKGRSLANWITVFEIICSLLFLFIFIQYETPNFLIQAFGVIVIIISVIMVPNRWINMIFVSLFLSIGFILVSMYYIDPIKLSEFLAGIIYIGIVFILCSINSYRIHYYQRNQYISNKELIKISTTDHLSKANNRVKLEEELKRWVDYSRRYSTPLSLMILDLDNFKEINDTYGHLVGDDVIIDTANLIRQNIREFDIFARWGGDEFIILLPNTDKLSAVELAERLRKNVESHFSSSETPKATCSFGVVQMSRDDNITSLIHNADQMLYLAKKEGKNLVYA